MRRALAYGYLEVKGTARKRPARVDAKRAAGKRTSGGTTADAQWSTWWYGLDAAWQAAVRQSVGWPDGAEPSAAQLRGLGRLRDLQLSHLNLRTLEPLRRLTALKTLSVAGCRRLADFSALTDIKRLQALNVSHTAFSSIKAIAKLSSLRQLFADATPLQTVDGVQALRQLRTLFVQSTRVADVAPVARLTQLECFGIARTRVRSLEPLRKLRRLTQVHLHDTAVSDLSPLHGLPRLRELHSNFSKVRTLEPFLSQGAGALESFGVRGLKVPAEEKRAFKAKYPSVLRF